MKKVLIFLLTASLIASLTSCKKKTNIKVETQEVERKIVIYSNADDEAASAIKTTLDSNGYKDKYLFQSFGTSELGGKLLAEGASIEADVITMSSFYIDSVQEERACFAPLLFNAPCLTPHADYLFPIIAIQGSIIVNTAVLKEDNIPSPTSIADLSLPIYKDNISVVDIQGSTTAWLMIQALLENYGEDKTKTLLTSIYANAGPHLELSGSGPIKKVRSGEVAIGFGLRHQALRDKMVGLPIDYVDPSEGNYLLTESVAVIKKDKNFNIKAMDVAEIIVKKARSLIIGDYPVALYEGESVDEEEEAANTKLYGELLTTKLLAKHKELSESCK